MSISHNTVLGEMGTMSLEPRTSTDISLSRGAVGFLVAIWLCFCLAGLVVIVWDKNVVLGMLIMGVPTFLIMLLRPSFALCVMLLALPTGIGVGAGEVFSLNKGVGIMVALSFGLNLLLTRPRLHVRHGALWPFLGYSLVVALAPLYAFSPYYELGRTLTQFMFVLLVFGVYWIVETNTSKTLLWALRSYVAGMIGTMAVTFATGRAMASEAESAQGRVSTVAGNIERIDPNMLAAMVALAFLTAIYLLLRDRNLLWKAVSVVSIIFLPVVLLQIGSRGAVVALGVTLVLPLFFVWQTVHKPGWPLVVIILAIVLATASMALLRRGEIGKRAAAHLLDPKERAVAVEDRVTINLRALEIASRYPMGTTDTRWRALNFGVHPHCDFFYALAKNGILAAAFFAIFLLLVVLAVVRMPLTVEKFYAQAVVIFLIVMGGDIVQLWKKYLWIFFVIALLMDRVAREAVSGTPYMDSIPDSGVEESEEQLGAQ